MRSKNHAGETRMRTATWAILGSLGINLMLGLVFATVFSVSPPVKAAELRRCSAQAAAHAPQAPQPPAQPARSGHRYIVAVRMGWAM
jgi:hypothetical protein